MGFRLSLLEEMDKRAVFRGGLLRCCLLCAIGGFSLLGTILPKTELAPETVSFANVVLSSKVAVSSAATNKLATATTPLATEPSVDSGGRNTVHSEKSEKSQEGIQRVQEPRIDMEVLGGIALLVWILRLRSFGT